MLAKGWVFPEWSPLNVNFSRKNFNERLVLALMFYQFVCVIDASAI